MKIIISTLMAHEFIYLKKYKMLEQRCKYFHIESTQHKDRFICVKCKDILIEPFQTVCGCRICRDCLNKITITTDSACPGCSEIYHDMNHNTYDRAVEKEILDLEIDCLHRNCKTTSKFRDLKDHLDVCEHRDETCTECNECYPMIERQEHLSVKCKMIRIKCRDCGIEMTKKDFYEIHKNEKGNITLLCDEWKDVCPYQCSDTAHDIIKIHLKTCPTMPLDCVMKEIGCHKVVQRNEMDNHVRNEVGYHMELFTEVLSELTKENVTLKKELSDNVKEKSSEIQRLSQIVASMSVQINKLNEQIKTCVNNVNVLENEATFLRKCVRNTMGKITWTIDNIFEKINNSKKGFNLTFFSEPFYSDDRGYKLCLKLYPNGDGKGLGQSLSLYFVIMRGEYDDEIHWPFDRSICLSLITKMADNCNRMIKMKPDNNDKCYGKPLREYNLAAGDPNFVRHHEIYNSNQFVENGSLTFHAQIL